MNTTTVREKLAARDGLRCRRCGIELSLAVFNLHKPFASIDHIRPRSKGGSECLENLELLCHPCNQTKGNFWDGSTYSVRRFAVVPGGLQIDDGEE